MNANPPRARVRHLIVAAVALIATACTGSTSNTPASTTSTVETLAPTPTVPVTVNTPGLPAVDAPAVAAADVEAEFVDNVFTPTDIDPALAAAAAVDGKPVPVPDAAAAEDLRAIGTVTIPKLGVTENLFEGITLRTLDHGPGHWPGTPLPGEVGNMVVAGHRVSHTHPFRDIHELDAGDEITVTGPAGTPVAYRVVDKPFVVTPDDAATVIGAPDATGSWITLFACHPQGSTKYRIVVRAKAEV